MYQQHMLLKLRKPIFKKTLTDIMSIGFASFKHLKLPVSTKIPVTIWQIVYSFFTKFDIMSYAFAKLVVARLYVVTQNVLVHCH